MKLTFNQAEITAIIQEFINQNLAIQATVVDFDIKGLRMQEGYQLEVTTSDIKPLSVEYGREDEQCNGNHLAVIFGDLTEPAEQPTVTPVEAYIGEKTVDEKTKQVTEELSEGKPEDKPTDTKEVPQDITVEMKSETKSVEKSIETSPKITDMDVDIFGNPIPKAKTFEELEKEQKKSKESNSLFSN